MPHARFTIRYRLPGRVPALLVEEQTGGLFTVDPHGIRARLADAGDGPTMGDRLRRQGWVRVPEVAPYRLDELQRLLAPAA